MSPDKVEGVLDALAPEGLLIGTQCDTEQEARELLRRVEKKTRTKFHRIPALAPVK